MRVLSLLELTLALTRHITRGSGGVAWHADAAACICAIHSILHACVSCAKRSRCKACVAEGAIAVIVMWGLSAAQLCLLMHLQL